MRTAELAPKIATRAAELAPKIATLVRTAELAPKIATLVRLAAAGLPVPEGVALASPDEPDSATWTRIESLLQTGPVIVRAALLDEDGPEHAGAGLGSSIADCHDRDAVRDALRHIADALRDPWLTAYFPAPPRAQVLVQREVVGPWLAVVAQTQLRHLELHRRDSSTTSDHEPLAAGLTPTLAGPLALFPAALRTAIDALCDQVTAALPHAPHGLDLELVADHDERVWLVQARPLTRPLHPGWPAFAAAARHDLHSLDDPPLTASTPPAPTSTPDRDPPDLGKHRDDPPSTPTSTPDRDPASIGEHRNDPPSTDEDANQPLPLPGLWRLDGEHNPAALSPAHAGLVRRLARERPALVRARVIAGWLYEPDQLTRADRVSDPAALRRALHELRTRHIPEARAALTALEHQLRSADRPALATLVDHACELLRDVLERHAALPARPSSLVARTDHPLCLDARVAHLDVLPATWDIASPTLLDLSHGTALAELRDLPTSPTDELALATLIGELDDHLFALGLAPLRRCYLRAAAALDIADDDIFLLPPDTLQAVLRGASPELAPRRAEHRARARLFPPLQLFAGLPVPGRSDDLLHGVAIGPVVEGPLTQRRDLAALLAEPPPPGAVLAIPALTAQAAVVLRALGVRAVCCEHGGAMSHAALMARELGLSALIGCRGCTTVPTGTWVRLDTRTGRLRVRPS
ncbi:PEP-utilizing enzyme [Nannocystis sp.]|uniref:PEP-utilizing enzyme n=1 Tax=Nannocystis sp. TaxID=1962667 RepID=UPI0025E61E2B|nr:PEP-utilizing enzyme [Nannocystis sp.]MBK7824843.1 hypothetical protein [Nannocystis sp.]